mmetsp:Transcript_22574/g.57129  ORF Transcript_22574/g.57129 Transcript_22574/m.57129 type:complete len:303 (-) Transcript_22574:1274-2182(-)
MPDTSMSCCGCCPEKVCCSEPPTAISAFPRGERGDAILLLLCAPNTRSPTPVTAPAKEVLDGPPLLIIGIGLEPPSSLGDRMPGRLKLGIGPTDPALPPRGSASGFQFLYAAPPKCENIGCANARLKFSARFCTWSLATKTSLRHSSMPLPRPEICSAVFCPTRACSVIDWCRDWRLASMCPIFWSSCSLSRTKAQMRSAKVSAFVGTEETLDVLSMVVVWGPPPPALVLFEEWNLFPKLESVRNGLWAGGAGAVVSLLKDEVWRPPFCRVLRSSSESLFCCTEGAPSRCNIFSSSLDIASV